MSRKTFFWFLTIPFILEWTVLAFGVNDRPTWILENILVFVLGGPAVWLYFKGSLSKTAFGLVMAFVALHCVGAHYSYSKVPYDAWTQSFFGFSLKDTFGLERNHFDRLIHFLWGLLLYLPAREIVYRFTNSRGVELAVFAFFTIVVTSSFYELIEWGAAEFSDKETGLAYVGAQGDVWDAQKDHALATVGALVALGVFGRKGNPRE